MIAFTSFEIHPPTDWISGRCPLLKPGKLISLAEQNLMDCSFDYGNIGELQWTFDYIKENKGVDTGAFYPYLEKING